MKSYIKNLTIGIGILMSVLFTILPSTAQSVGPDGSLNYAIDIKLPPGTAGVAPRLSLVYNSNAGNGICGMGWNLAGLPVITRDTTYPIKYDGTDHYVGENGRLVKTGVNEFRNEYENFSKFVMSGGCGGNPAEPTGWMETRPDGSKVYYGYSFDSMIYALNRPFGAGGFLQQFHRAWAVNKVEDVHGNYYTVSYDQFDGEYYPKEIVYTMNASASIPKTRKVCFEYVTRPDHCKKYTYATGVDTAKRLNKIIITVDGSTVRTYELTYMPDASAIVPSRLAKVQEFGSDGEGLPAVTFEWNTINNWWSYKTNGTTYKPFNCGEPSRYFFNADIDGDGKSDLIHLGTEGNQYGIINTGNGWALTWPTFTFGDGDPTRYRYVDINGDGKIDIIHIGSEGNQYGLINTGNGWTLGPSFSSFGNGDPTRYRHVDVDGDGRVDIVYIATNGDISCLISNGNGWTPGPTFLSNGNGGGLFPDLGCSTGGSISLCLNSLYWNPDRYFYNDITGDGKTDIIFMGLDLYNGTLVNAVLSLVNSGTGWIKGPVYYNWGGEPARIFCEDINGDGLVDIINVGTDGTLSALTNTGNGWVAGPQSKFGDGTPSRYFRMDLNGDGKCDIVYLDADGVLSYYLNTGNGWSLVISCPGIRRGDPMQYIIADFNGDSRLDIVHLETDGTLYPILNDFTSNNYITRITSSATSTIEYALSTDKTKNPYAIIPGNSSYPVVANSSPRNLVNKITTTDGREGKDESIHTYTTTYGYCNGKMKTGKPYERKDLGFWIVGQTDDRTGATTNTFYSMDPEYAGKITKIENNVQVNGNPRTIKRVSYQYNAPNELATTYGTKHIRLKMENTETYEPNTGALLFTTVRDYQAYDDYGNLKTMVESGTNIATVTTSMLYDVDTTNWILNRLIDVQKSSNGLLQHQSFTYLNNNLSSKTDYDVKGDTGTSNVVTSFTYDAYGNPNTISNVVNGLPQITGITYDDDYHTFQKTVTNPLGQTASFTFDARFGVKTSETDLNGNTTTYTYDQFGRLAKVQEPGTDWSRMVQYNRLGDPTRQMVSTWTRDDSAGGFSFQDVYIDGLGREYKTVSKGVDGYMMTVDRYFNEHGKVKKESNPYVTMGTTAIDPTMYYTEYTYDSAGRVISKKSPDNQTTSISYLVNSADSWAMVTSTNPASQQSVSHYDARGQLRKKSEAGGYASVLYEYDPLGRLTKTTACGRETAIEYDGLGRKKSINDPNKGLWQYTYDALGRLQTQTDAMNKIIRFDYDAANRVTREYTNDLSVNVNYYYDTYIGVPGYNEEHPYAVGRLTGVDDGVSKSLFVYDRRGNSAGWKQQVDGKTFCFNMEYTRDRKVKSLTYPQGDKIIKSYADAGNLKAVQDAAGGGYFVQYYKKGVTDPTIVRQTNNGVKTEIAYNPVNYRPLTVVSRSTNLANTKLEEVNYSDYDAIGNIKQIDDMMDATRSQSFAYDTLNRLTSASSGLYGNQSFGYDNQGNLTHKAGVTLNYGYGNRPHAVSSDNRGTGTTYTYDDNGNMTSKSSADANYAYVFDAKNRLTSVTKNGALVETYFYDYTGHRVKTVRSDGITSYNIGGLFELTTKAGCTPQHTRYIYGISGELVAQRTSSGDTALYTSDNLLIRERFFTFDGPLGLVKYGYVALNELCRDKANLRLAANAAMGLVLLALALAGLYFRSRRREEIIFWKRWVADFAPLVLLLYVGAFGLTGCDFGGSGGGSTITESTVPGAIDAPGLPKNGIYYFHPDHVGSVKYVTDETGNVVYRMAYEPYGGVLRDEPKSGGSSGDRYPYKYTSQRDDVATGLMYYKARYYDPGIGRFISADSLIPDLTCSQAFNSYMYVEGNPISKNDPTGHYPSFQIPYIGDDTPTDHDGRTNDIKFMPFAGHESLVSGNHRGHGPFGEWSPLMAMLDVAGLHPTSVVHDYFMTECYDGSSKGGKVAWFYGSVAFNVLLGVALLGTPLAPVGVALLAFTAIFYVIGLCGGFYNQKYLDTSVKFLSMPACFVVGTTIAQINFMIWQYNICERGVAWLAYKSGEKLLDFMTEINSKGMVESIANPLNKVATSNTVKNMLNINKAASKASNFINKIKFW